jgi:uncharacterized membrane protein
LESALYNKLVSVTVLAMLVLVAFSVIEGSIFITVVAVIVPLAIIFLYLLNRRVTEVRRDERSSVIYGKAASATLAIVTVSMTVVGLSLVFLSGRGMGDYEQTGYLLAFQASFILILNALLSYYYKSRLGG